MVPRNTPSADSVSGVFGGPQPKHPILLAAVVARQRRLRLQAPGTSQGDNESSGSGQSGSADRYIGPSGSGESQVVDKNAAHDDFRSAVVQRSGVPGFFPAGDPRAGDNEADGVTRIDELDEAEMEKLRIWLQRLGQIEDAQEAMSNGLIRYYRTDAEKSEPEHLRIVVDNPGMAWLDRLRCLEEGILRKVADCTTQVDPKTTRLQSIEQKCFEGTANNAL